MNFRAENLIFQYRCSTMWQGGVAYKSVPWWRVGTVLEWKHECPTDTKEDKMKQLIRQSVTCNIRDSSWAELFSR